MKNTLKINIPQGFEVDNFDIKTGEITFKEVIKDITERIKTFDDVLSYLTEIDEEVIEYRKLINANITSRALYFQMSVCFVKALNEKFILDWANSNEYKYYIWWYLDTFRLSCVNGYCGSSNVPSALCFKNKKLAEYAGSNGNFIEIMKKYML